MAQSRMSAVATRTSVITNTKLAIAVAFLGAASLAAAAAGTATTNPCANEPLSKVVSQGQTAFCAKQTLKLTLVNYISPIFDVGPFNATSLTLYSNGTPFQLSLTKGKSALVTYSDGSSVTVVYLGLDADGRGLINLIPVSSPTNECGNTGYGYNNQYGCLPTGTGSPVNNNAGSPGYGYQAPAVVPTVNPVTSTPSKTTPTSTPVATKTTSTVQTPPTSTQPAQPTASAAATCIDPDNSYQPNLNSLLAAGPAWNKINTLNASSLKTKTVITIANPNGYGRPLVLTDGCSGTKQINEAICFDANQAGQYVFDCPSGTMCAAGACIAKSFPVTSCTGSVCKETTVSLPQVVITGVTPIDGSGQTLTIVPGSVIGKFKVTNNGFIPISLGNVFKIADSGYNSSSSLKYDLFKSDANNSNVIYPAISTSKKVNGILTFDTSKVIVQPGQSVTLTIKIGGDGSGGLATGNSFQLWIPDSSLTFSFTEQDFGMDVNKNGSDTDIIGDLPVLGQPSLGTLSKT